MPLRMFQALFNNLILPLRLPLSPFTDKKTEAQRREVAYIASCQISGINDQTGLEPGLPAQSVPGGHQHSQMNLKGQRSLMYLPAAIDHPKPTGHQTRVAGLWPTT